MRSLETLRHYKAYRTSAFAREERGRVAILFGGMTSRHERLAAAAIRSLGHRVELLPNPGKRDFDAGKELIDPGACCPAYFTAGCLANVLRDKVAHEGRDAVARNYVFLTAGGCGACRFGQYRESYALALENIGLADFRMFNFVQDELVTPSRARGGLELDAPFILGVVWAFMCADLLGDLAYMARPYELVPGETDRALAASLERLERAFRERPRQRLGVSTLGWYLGSGYFERVLREIASLWGAIRVDRLRVKPKVKVTGEFWLQLHEGEGNYDIKRWLEQEGAEVDTTAISIWIDYLLYDAIGRLAQRREAVAHYAWKRAWLRLTRGAFLRAYRRLRAALLDLPHALPSQDELVRLAAPFYRFPLNGGEGHLLVAKALLAHRHRLAHMVCELAPYGCLPSTTSVGVMAHVLGKHPDLLYAPIEVKGDAEVHALSRCQMILTEAKRRAQQEFARALSETGLSVQRIREWEARHPAAQRLDAPVARRGLAGTAANYVLYVAGEGAR